MRVRSGSGQGWPRSGDGRPAAAARSHSAGCTGARRMLGRGRLGRLPVGVPRARCRGQRATRHRCHELSSLQGVLPMSPCTVSDGGKGFYGCSAFYGSQGARSTRFSRFAGFTVCSSLHSAEQHMLCGAPPAWNLSNPRTWNQHLSNLRTHRTVEPGPSQTLSPSDLSNSAAERLEDPAHIVGRWRFNVDAFPRDRMLERHA